MPLELRSQAGPRAQPATRTGARAPPNGTARPDRPRQAGQALRSPARRRPGPGPHPHEPRRESASSSPTIPRSRPSASRRMPPLRRCTVTMCWCARMSCRDVAAQEPAEVTGRVVRVLESARTQLVGTLQRGRQFLYVIPDDPRITQDIYVPPPRDTGRPARIGDKVVVELREWKSRHVNPEGEIIEVLGPPDAEGVDMLSVIRQYNLALHFPKKVLQEARRSGREVKPAERAGRVDCRKHQVVTIDPDDAKDFDDAICLERVGPGALEAVGAYRRRVALREARQRARRGSPQARQLDLPGGPRGPDAARSAEQRAVFAQAAGGPPDQVRRVPALDRWPGPEDAVLSRRSSARSTATITRRSSPCSSARRATPSSTCCTTPMRSPRRSAARASRPARSTWTSPRRRSGSTSVAGCCAWRRSRTTSRTSSSRNACCWPTRRWRPG